LAIVLLVFTASNYIIGILAIVLFFFSASDYIINDQDTNDVIRGVKTNKTMAKIPMM
jgi:uncharacterized membrane protein YqiK